METFYGKGGVVAGQWDFVACHKSLRRSRMIRIHSRLAYLCITLSSLRIVWSRLFLSTRKTQFTNEKAIVKFPIS